MFDYNTLIILLLISIPIRVVVYVYCGKVAVRKNRSKKTWQTLGLIFPALSMIVVGFLSPKSAL